MNTKRVFSSLHQNNFRSIIVFIITTSNGFHVNVVCLVVFSHHYNSTMLKWKMFFYYHSRKCNYHSNIVLFPWTNLSSFVFVLFCLGVEPWNTLIYVLCFCVFVIYMYAIQQREIYRNKIHVLIKTVHLKGSSFHSFEIQGTPIHVKYTLNLVSSNNNQL